MSIRIRSLVVVLAMLFGMTLSVSPVNAGGAGTLLSRINSSRAGAGLAPLETYWDLTDDARAQANRMAAEGRVFHNPSLASVNGVWQALGENVGVGWDLNEMHDSFMASGAHRANILGNYNYVGIGVTTDDDGAIWASVVFMRAEPGLNGGDTTTTTVAPTTTTTAPPPAPSPLPDPPPTISPDPTSPDPTSPEPTPTTTKAPPPPPKATVSKAPAPQEETPARVLIEAWGRPDGPIVD